MIIIGLIKVMLIVSIYFVEKNNHSQTFSQTIAVMFVVEN